MLTCLSIPHNINCTGSYKLKAKLICLYAVNLSHLTQIGDKMIPVHCIFQAFWTKPSFMDI